MAIMMAASCAAIIVQAGHASEFGCTHLLTGSTWDWVAGRLGQELGSVAPFG